MNKKRYRHEKKYYISTGTAAIIRSKLKGVAKLDKNVIQTGTYFIRSLYFDDYFDRAYRDKELGVVDRKKYRIRIYNCSDKIINLERKKKYGEYIYKESAPINRNEFENILNEKYEFLLHSHNNLLREFYYECKSNLMRPKITVDYNRVPYVNDHGTVRITLDLNLRATIASFDIFDKKLPTIPAISKQTHILEVKFTEFIPSIYRSALLGIASQNLAASKYVMCREAIDFQRDRLNALYEPSYNENVEKILETIQ